MPDMPPPAPLPSWYVRFPRRLLVFPITRLHQETFVVIRSLLADEFIVKRFLVMPLYHFLQNCLAVIEQLLVFNIRQNEAGG